MDAIAQLIDQYRQAHQALEGTMADVEPEQVHWGPPGKAIPIGASYAHTLTGEDGVLNGMIRKAAPLYLSAWAGRLGMSELPPQGPSWDEWARRVQIDLPSLRAYGQAVYDATDAYLTSLTPADLDVEIDGFLGRQTVGSYLAGLALHVAWHTGEISSVKGLQGAQGYPF
jgi:DinB superfamily